MVCNTAMDLPGGYHYHPPRTRGSSCSSTTGERRCQFVNFSAKRLSYVLVMSSKSLLQRSMTIGLIEPKPRSWTGECTLTVAKSRITAVPTSTFNTVSLFMNELLSLQHHPNSSLANSLLSIDLSKDWTSDSVRFDSTSKPTGAANLAGAGIWVDETEGVLYTGFAGVKSSFGDNANQPQGLWSFKPDGKGGGTWQNLNSTADKTFTEKPRPFKGKTASGNGVGYFLGGTQPSLPSLRNF